MRLDIEEIIMWTIIIAVAGTISFFVYDGLSGPDNVFSGKIHEMTFVHGNQSTTVGMAFTSKGAAPVIATSGHPDEWSMIVLVNNTYVKVECSANEYYHHEIGDQVRIVQSVGGVTGILYGTKLYEDTNE